jgi:hypothetical protein
MAIGGPGRTCDGLVVGEQRGSVFLLGVRMLVVRRRQAQALCPVVELLDKLGLVRGDPALLLAFAVLLLHLVPVQAGVCALLPGAVIVSFAVVDVVHGLLVHLIGCVQRAMEDALDGEVAGGEEVYLGLQQRLTRAFELRLCLPEPHGRRRDRIHWLDVLALCENLWIWLRRCGRLLRQLEEPRHISFTAAPKLGQDGALTRPLAARHDGITG